MTVALRVAITVAAVPTIIWGLLGVFWREGILDYVRIVSGGSAQLSREVDYLLQPLGLFQLFFGAMLLRTLRDPVRQSFIVRAAAIAIVGRSLQRFVHTDTFEELYGISRSTNLFHASYLSLLGLTILALSIVAGRRAVTSSARDPHPPSPS